LIRPGIYASIRASSITTSETRLARVFLRLHSNQETRYAMHDSDFSTVIAWVGGVVLSALGWLINREIRRNDEYGARIDDIEKTIPGLVKHTDLERTETTIINAINDLKGEIRGERDRINRLTEHRN